MSSYIDLSSSQQDVEQIGQTIKNKNTDQQYIGELKVLYMCMPPQIPWPCCVPLSSYNDAKHTIPLYCFQTLLTCALCNAGIASFTDLRP